MEIHILSGASSFDSFLLQHSIPIATDPQPGRWKFCAGRYEAGPKPDLFAIKQTTGTPEMEVHVLSGSSNYKNFLHEGSISIATDEKPGRWQFCVGSYDQDQRDDLFAIKQVTGVPEMEIHVLSGESNYRSFILQRRIPISSDSLPGRWRFALGNFDGDGKRDLFAIKQVTGTPEMEIHVMSGANDYAGFLLQRVIPIATDPSPGRWQFLIESAASFQELPAEDGNEQELPKDDTGRLPNSSTEPSAIKLASIPGPPEFRIHRFSAQNRTTTFEAFLEVNERLPQAAMSAIEDCAIAAATGALSTALFSSGTGAFPAFWAIFAPCIAAKGVSLSGEAVSLRFRTRHGRWHNIL